MLKRRTMLILVVVLTGVLAFGAMAAAAESMSAVSNAYLQAVERSPGQTGTGV